MTNYSKFNWDQTNDGEVDNIEMTDYEENGM